MGHQKYTFSIIVICVALLAIVSLGAISMPSILARHDLTHPEGIVPWAVYQVAQGKPLYVNWQEWPHRFMPYGGLLTYPIGLTARILEVEGYGFHYYLAGRLQSVLYLIGTGLLITLLFRSAGMRFWLGFTFSFSYLTLWTAILLAALSFRADMPALFWAVAAALMGYNCRLTPLRLLPVLACFMISIAYKPALWAFPAALTLFLFKQHQFKLAFMWCAAVILAVIAYIGIGELATDGNFLLNQAGASSMGVSVDTFRSAYEFLLTDEPFPIFAWDTFLRLVLALLIAGILVYRSPHRIDAGIGIYYIVALLLNMLAMFKVGSGLNYLLEAYALSGIVLGLAVLRIYQYWPHLNRNVRYSSVTLGIVLLVLPLPFYSFHNFAGAKAAFEKLNEVSPYEELHELPATALLGDLAYTHPAPGAHALSDPLPYVQLVKQGKISQAPFAKRLSSQVFSHIVMSPGTKYLFYAEDKAPWAGKLLDEHYEQVKAVPEYEIWVPKKNRSALQPDGTLPMAAE